jgi:predicted dehydrogenase
MSDGRWSIVAADRSFAATVQAGYRPERHGWCISAVQGHDGATPVTVAPSLEPVHGHREPWAEAHAETARRFLAMIAGHPHEPLPSFGDGALTQRVLGAAIAANAGGRRSPLGS